MPVSFHEALRTQYTRTHRVLSFARLFFSDLVHIFRAEPNFASRNDLVSPLHYALGPASKFRLDLSCLSGGGRTENQVLLAYDSHSFGDPPTTAWVATLLVFLLECEIFILYLYG